ncbi:hypothetical protein C9139_22450, partial [Escherichia coli]
QGPIRHADCRQRKLADFLCTGGIIQGLISVAHQAINPTFSMWRGWDWITYDLPTVPALHPRWWCVPDAR